MTTTLGGCLVFVFVFLFVVVLYLGYAYLAPMTHKTADVDGQSSHRMDGHTRK